MFKTPDHSGVVEAYVCEACGVRCIGIWNPTCIISSECLNENFTRENGTKLFYFLILILQNAIISASG